MKKQDESPWKTENAKSAERRYICLKKKIRELRQKGKRGSVTDYALMKKIY